MLYCNRGGAGSISPMMDQVPLQVATIAQVAAPARPGLLTSVCAAFSQRAFRVVLLGVAIAAMSSVDLYLTLLYVTHTGMNEMNPLARAMMQYQSPFVLAVWKALTVAVSVGILLLIRKQRSAELGAWAGCLVLGWLMLHWSTFIYETRHMNLELVHEIAVGDPTWVVIDAAPDVAFPLSRRTVID